MTAKRYVRLAIVLCLFSMRGLVAQDSPHRQTIVLPNPDLIGCAGKTCAPPLDFIGDPAEMIFPTQIALDIGEKGCQYGFMAYYDKSVSAEQLRVALNERYPNAADPVGESPRGFWRLESE